MQLSTFDLSWYSRWPIQHTALEEWSRPGLTNGLGSLQAAADPCSIRHVMFPPVSGAEESTAYLTLNGTFLAATQMKTAVAWCPWAIDREAQHADWKIATRLSMPPDVHGVLQRITLTNTASTAQTLELGLRLSGRCVNRGIEKWYWGVPGVATTLAGLLESTGLDPITEILPEGLLTQERAPEGTEAGRAFNAQLLSPAPHHWNRNGDAGWTFPDIAPGESVTLYLALALGETRDSAIGPARALLADPAAAFRDAEAHWRELWRSAFAPDGPLSGQVPDLDVPEDLAPAAVSALLSLLQARRTHRVAGGKSFYNISTPRRVEACYYPNDWSMTARSLAQLDPEPTWRQLEMALAADVRKYNQINFLTGRGGDAMGPGWPYTVDIYNAFYAAWQLWSAECGVRSAECGTRGAECLHRKLTTASGDMTLLEVFEDLAFDWRSRRVDKLGLADYGSKHELLECVSTYEHVVASLNAAAVWMLRRLADVYRVLDRNDDALAADLEADGLRDALLQHLYVDGCGWFRCIRLDGRAKEVRHCWDTGMVLMCIGAELPAKVQDEIVHFFQSELQTPGWIRALSPHDGDAAVSGLRADHQFNGAFGSWPAEVALGLLRIGRADLVKDWLTGIAHTARQGPFGQAYYDEGVEPATHGGATKVTDETPQCCHWSNISGGLFFTVIEELVVGQPAKERAK
ncbi:MAG: hypothetical protein JJU29_17005 [Verrucomicrobia bacterium]|nr:hypothetical protein [Verrucomicrobiota bacterium]MCH8512419.1 hypothetical protein [Kiritimatiellia bacterium]